MSIADKTGEQPSITGEDRALQYFTDRHALIRRFVEQVHAEPPPERILFFHGDGGNGKSLLLRYLRTHWCKQLRYWEHNRSLSDAELVERLQKAEHVTPLPVAELDFNQQPRAFEQPKQAYDGLLMLRRQLGGHGLAFPLYDFASIWYLHKDGKLTEERLKALFPAAEMDLVLKLADVATGGVVGGIVEGVLGVFHVRFKEQWALRRLQAIADEGRVEKIMQGDYKTLPLHLPTYFAEDLNAAMRAKDALPRLVLFFDGYESLQRVEETRDAGGWVRPSPDEAGSERRHRAGGGWAVRAALGEGRGDGALHSRCLRRTHRRRPLLEHGCARLPRTGGRRGRGVARAAVRLRAGAPRRGASALRWAVGRRGAASQRAR